MTEQMTKDAENERLREAIGSALSFIDKVPGRKARELYYGIVDSLPRDSDGGLPWEYAALMTEPQYPELQWKEFVRAERAKVADLLDRAGHFMTSMEDNHPGEVDYYFKTKGDAITSDELFETAARMRQDVKRVGVPASAGPMERLEAMEFPVHPWTCGQCRAELPERKPFCDDCAEESTTRERLRGRWGAEAD